MKLTLRIWRQKNAKDTGAFETLEAPHVSPDMSFLEMLDVVNEDLQRTIKLIHRIVECERHSAKHQIVHITGEDAVVPGSA